MAIETPRYQTIVKEGKYEIRIYDPMIIAKTFVEITNFAFYEDSSKDNIIQ